MYTELRCMDSRARRVAAIIILFAGLLFVVDVLSPATPIPLAVHDTISLVFGVLILLGALMRPLFRLIAPALRCTLPAIGVYADRVFGIRSCVLLC